MTGAGVAASGVGVGRGAACARHIEGDSPAGTAAPAVCNRHHCDALQGLGLWLAIGRVLGDYMEPGSFVAATTVAVADVTVMAAAAIFATSPLF